MVEQSFETVKIGVCDCFWRPVPTTATPNPEEVYLGLTKGGVELAYTPEWYEIQVDQFGKTATESVLIGETIVATVPLAETDIGKLELFAHTATKISEMGKEKLVFGRRPGLRLEGLAGRLRLHPIAMGGSNDEDVVIYRAVNKAPMALNYRVDEERIYSIEFNGIVARQSLEAELAGIDGAFLWQIGNPNV